MVTARFTLLLKPLMAATVTVVFPVEFGLIGIVLGARLMAMLGVTVDDGEMLAVAPLIAVSPETLRVTADWKLPSGSILAVIVLEPPLGIAIFCGLA